MISMTSRQVCFRTLAAMVFCACPFLGDVRSQDAAPSTEVRVIRGGQPIALSDALIERNGRRILLIDMNEVIELSIEGDIDIESASRGSVRILDNKYLVGLAPGVEVDITFLRGGVPVTPNGVGRLIVAVEDVDSGRPIVAESTFLPYKSVKDNFGKKFAQSFFVVQVDIRNEKIDKQFIVQNVSVIIDPNQCIRAERELFDGFDSRDCLGIFNTFFIYPTPHLPMRPEEVLATGKADLARSNRNVGFRVLEFAASMGTVLTGFNGVLGPDGVKGVNVLGTTVTSAANLLFPNTSAAKLENLQKALPAEDLIIKSKESKIVNIFIPTDRIFYSESWQRYIKPARESDADAYKLRVALDMLLLSTATGVLVDNDAPKVVVRSGDDVEQQKEKFGITNLLSAAYDDARKARDIRRQLRQSAYGDVAAQLQVTPKVTRALTLMQQASAGANPRIRVTTTTSFTAADTARVLFDRLEAAIRNAFSNATDEIESARATHAILKILEEAIKE